MRIPAIAILLMTLASAGPLLAGRSPGFSMHGFNLAVPVSARDAVFSPFSFEYDCAIISEAADTLERARYVEQLGALVGYDSIYKPLIARYADARTNDFKLVSSRTYLASSLSLVSPRFRTFLQQEYSVLVCPVWPSAKGAECFIRVSMDGEMEDFRVPEKAFIPNGVSFCDLESFHCAWAEPFPTSATCRVTFAAANGRREMVEMMKDLRVADLWQGERYTMLRLPLADDAWFYAVLSDPGAPLDVVRGGFAAETFNERLLVFRTVGDPALYHGPVEVALPKLDFDTTIDLVPAFRGAELSIGSFKEIMPKTESSLAVIMQRTKFRLDESGPSGLRIGAKNPKDEVYAGRGVRKFIADRPFLFFVYHEPTRTVPVAGVFAGVK